MTWNLGYNIDCTYTFGYYREQDPAWMDLCALRAGWCPPPLTGAAKLRYLELGCGQGFGLCLIAACHPHIEFVGIDFNPAHIAHGQQLATAARLSNVRFVEASFTDLGAQWPAELGQFHYASAHGILSWIAPAVREGLYRCLDAALLPGGLFYASYNTLPGWYSGQPIQHLLRLWQVREGLSSGAVIEEGIKRLQQLDEASSIMTRVLPGMKPRLDGLLQHDRAYLIGEYLTEHWTCFWFDQFQAEVASHKLSYAGTACAQDWYLPAMLPEASKAVLNIYTDPVEREVMFDVLINQSFRRDLWVKGQAPLWAGRQRAALLATRVALLARPAAKEGSDNPYQFKTSLGEVSGKPEVYAPLYDALQGGSKTLAELMQTPRADAQPRALADTLQALGLMLAAGHAALAHGRGDNKAAKGLNRVVAEAALAGAPYRFLVAGALPTVLTETDIDLMLMFLALHLNHPKADAAQLGAKLTEQLLILNRGLKHDGQALTTREALTPRAVDLAQAFLAQTLPIWQRLGVL